MRSSQDARSARHQPTSPSTAPVLLLLPRMLCRFAIVAHLFTTSAEASTLLAAASGSADSATAGSTVAEPLSPLGAQFSNPAGMAGFTERAMGLGVGLAYGRGEVTASTPAGYHAENEVLVPFLDNFLVVPSGRWTFSLGTMGTSGARFDYGARPNVGVPDGFFSETAMLGVPIGAAYRFGDRLWLGAELILLYGSTHLRYSTKVAELPEDLTPFRFTVEGFGVQAMLGMTWKPDDRWSIGVGVKPPGQVWADGDSKLGAGKQDVKLDLEVPAEFDLGISRKIKDRWKASYSLRFCDTSALADSTIRFDETPSADSPYLPAARDEWKHALGLEYTWSDSLDLLGGVSEANAIVADKGVNPASYDSTDVRLNAGFHRVGPVWIIDGSFGYVFAGTRHIGDEALVFPGEYDSKPAYLLSVTITKKF